MVNRKYNSGLDSKFKGNHKVILGDYIIKTKRDRIIPKGTLVIMPSSGAISLKILEKDTQDKGFSTPFVVSEAGSKLGITAQYLLWFFKQDFVTEYHITTATGTVMPRIPKQVLYDLKIPLPIHSYNAHKKEKDESVIITDSPFKKLIDKFYEDYRFNFDKAKYTTSVILAGAIAEAILYQLLIDSDVDSKILDNDRALGFGKLITYIKLLKLNEQLEKFPLNHFEELQKHRNAAIHVGLAVKRPAQFTKRDLACFDQIIKYFGI